MTGHDEAFGCAPSYKVAEELKLFPGRFRTSSSMLAEGFEVLYSCERLVWEDRLATPHLAQLTGDALPYVVFEMVVLL